MTAQFAIYLALFTTGISAVIVLWIMCTGREKLRPWEMVEIYLFLTGLFSVILFLIIAGLRGLLSELL